MTLSDLERRDPIQGDQFFRRIFVCTLVSFDIERPNLAR